MRNSVLYSVAVLVIGAVSVVAAQAPAQGGRGGAQVTLPEGAGKELVQTTCSKCHGLNLVTNSGGYSKQEWDQLASSMVQLPKDQHEAITSYLAKNFQDKG